MISHIDHSQRQDDHHDSLQYGDPSITTNKINQIGEEGGVGVWGGVLILRN